MRARMKNGKVISGKLAETFARIGIASEVSNELDENGNPIVKKKGNIKNLKNQKVK